MRHTYINVFFVFICVITIILGVYKAVSYAQVGTDTGYYLCASKNISEGIIPNRDYIELYPPAVFYIFSILFSLDTSSYGSFILVNMFFVVGASLLITQIAIPEKKAITLKAFIMLSIFLTIYSLDGILIYLEQITLFWAALGLYFYLRYKSPISCFAAGCLMALAFLSKQYGILFVIPIGLSILFFDKNKIKRIFIVGFGLLAILTTFILIAHFIQDIPAENLKNHFWNNSYGSRKSGDFIWKFKDFIVRDFFIITVFIIIYLTFISFTLIRKKTSFSKLHLQKNEFLLLTSGCLLSLTLYFPYYYFSHYAMLFAPFLVAFIITYFSRISSLFSFKQYLNIALIITIMIQLNVAIRTILWGINKKIRSEQFVRSSKLNNIIPKRSTVTILTDQYERYRYLSELNPPLPLKYGYSFSSNMTKEQQKENISKSEYVLLRKDDTSMNIYLDSLNYSKKDLDSTITIRKKSLF